MENVLQCALLITVTTCYLLSRALLQMSALRNYQTANRPLIEKTPKGGRCANDARPQPHLTSRSTESKLCKSDSNKHIACCLTLAVSLSPSRCLHVVVSLTHTLSLSRYCRLSIFSILAVPLAHAGSQTTSSRDLPANRFSTQSSAIIESLDCLHRQFVFEHIRTLSVQPSRVEHTQHRHSNLRQNFIILFF